MTVPKAQTDPREGGQFTFVMQIPDGTEIPHTGTYMTIARPVQLVFTWDSPFSAEGSTVTLDFEAAGAGTKITLTHVKFPDAESRDNHSGGWSSILTALGNTLS